MTVRNWAGNVTFTPDHVERPASIEQLQELVARSPRIRALGTGHSFNRIADTDGVLVSTSELPLRIEVDEVTRTVDVSAAARYGELTTALQQRGWALPNLGSLPHISVAGACATGTHGSGDTNACLASSAVGVEFVRGDGELVSVSRDEPDFAGSVLALGALGVVTRLTLAVEPTFDVRQDVWLGAPMTTVLERLDEIMAGGYSVSMFTEFRTDRMTQIWVKTRAGAEPVDGRQWGATAATVGMHPLAALDGREATEQLGVLGPWHERLPHFRLAYTPSAGEEQQSEWMVPREHGAAAVQAVSELDLGEALQVAEVRTIAADDLWLSPFFERASLALHFTWVDDDDLVGRAVAAVERALEPFAARPHWGKVFHASPRPAGRAAFRELMARHDPERRFVNGFVERHLAG